MGRERGFSETTPSGPEFLPLKIHVHVDLTPSPSTLVAGIVSSACWQQRTEHLGEFAKRHQSRSQPCRRQQGSLVGGRACLDPAAAGVLGCSPGVGSSAQGALTEAENDGLFPLSRGLLPPQSDALQACLLQGMNPTASLLQKMPGGVALQLLLGYVGGRDGSQKLALEMGCVQWPDLACCPGLLVNCGIRTHGS